MNTEQTQRTIASIHIGARRWFQKSCGNTYHRVRISLTFTDGTSETFDSGQHYGYGQCWDQTALEMLEGSFGIHVPRYENGARHFAYLTTWARDNNVPVTTEVLDGRRERDL